MTPDDYLSRVYAGVLGKLIGVYAGRPFEGWTHARIMQDLGPIRHYVHQKLGDVPLVVTDDDVSGTFTFLRALEEHRHSASVGAGVGLSAEAIGQTWLNNVIAGRTVFWWGGLGISTEHTAYANLRRGVSAPASGSIESNGKTVAEQIGAQIFIDGWAMVSPGNPRLAAELAEQAARVSHDGESVYAAKVWAAMEAEAFVSNDVQHLLDVGLAHIPNDSLIAQVIRQVRAWVDADGDGFVRSEVARDGHWMRTRQRVDENYGYDKFRGACHVVPNHAIMIMALLYGHDDFHNAMTIVNTSGWDTDCNSGNVACLVAIMNGLSAFEGGPDWRGPLADRALISSADGGYSINNAARIAYDVANMGRRLAGEPPLMSPKNGAQFHFSLPGSVQGFRTATHDTMLPHSTAKVEQAYDEASRSPSLAIRINEMTPASSPVDVLTDTFTPPEVRNMPVYDLMASPLLYPGQTVKAAIHAGSCLTAPVKVGLRLKVYTAKDSLRTVDCEQPVTLDTGQSETLKWTIADDFGSQPIQSIGLVIWCVDGSVSGTLWLDNLGWDGTPRFSLQPSSRGSNEFWKRAFVNGADILDAWERKLSIAQDRGEGIAMYGTRDWANYRVVVRDFNINLGGPSGVAVRCQGLRRWYALLFTEGRNGRKELALVKCRDEERSELSPRIDFDWELDVQYTVTAEVEQGQIRFHVDGLTAVGVDDEYRRGGLGIIVSEGSVGVARVDVLPLG